MLGAGDRVVFVEAFAGGGRVGSRDVEQVSRVSRSWLRLRDGREHTIQMLLDRVFAERTQGLNDATSAAAHAVAAGSPRFHTFFIPLNASCAKLLILGGRCRLRTCDPVRVKDVLYP